MIQRLKWFYRAWRYRLKLERQEIAWLLDRLGPGDTAIDVGAHKGAYTYWMRRAVGPAGRVVAFEPQPDLAERLRDLVRTAEPQNVTVENMGLSSASGRLELKIPGRRSSPGASFEVTPDTLRPGHAVTVPVTTLDEFLASEPGLRIALIKCDTEGHELEVLRGAEKSLLRDCPALLIECEARHRRSGTPEEVFGYLARLGYRGWGLGRSGLFDIGEFDVGRHQVNPGHPDYVNNFCFTRDDGAARARA
jgi:FkbM family methyltransferase